MKEFLRKKAPGNSKLDLQGFLLGSTSIVKLSGQHKLPSKFDKVIEGSSENVDIQQLDEMSPEAQQLYSSFAVSFIFS